METQTPDLSDPLALLGAFHRRTFACCDLLERLAERVAAGAEAAELRSDAGEAVRHFGWAMVLHHDDEEKGLFPPLNPQSLKLADLIHTLKQEHAALQREWLQLAPLLERTSALVAERERFGELARGYAGRQRAHTAREEEELLFLARHSLSAAELAKIGKEMAARRGVQG